MRDTELDQEAMVVDGCRELGVGRTWEQKHKSRSERQRKERYTIKGDRVGRSQNGCTMTQKTSKGGRGGKTIAFFLVREASQWCQGPTVLSGPKKKIKTG